MVDRADAPLPIEEAKLYIESFTALEDLLSNLSPEERERLRVSTEALAAIRRTIDFHDRFALFRERLPVSSYTKEQRTFEAQGIIRDNIDAVLDCGNLVQRVARAA
jgi:hypothetical protein